MLGRLSIWAKTLLGCIVLTFVVPNFRIVLDLSGLPTGPPLHEILTES